MSDSNTPSDQTLQCPANSSSNDSIPDEEEFTCGVCLNLVNLPVKVPSCSHIFCFLCLKGVIVSLGKRCPLCRSTFDEEPEDLKLDRQVADEVEKITQNGFSGSAIIWQYSGRHSGWWDYDPVSNQEIETAYSTGLPSIDLSIGSTTFHLDLVQMNQEPVGFNGQRVRAIRRLQKSTAHSSKGIAGLTNRQ